MELIGGSSDRCQSSLLYDDGKGVRTLLLTLTGLRVCTDIVGIADVFPTSVCCRLDRFYFVNL